MLSRIASEVNRIGKKKDIMVPTKILSPKEMYSICLIYLEYSEKGKERNTPIAIPFTT